MRVHFRRRPQLCYRSSRYQTKIYHFRIIYLQLHSPEHSLALLQHRYLQPVLYWTSRSMRQHYLLQRRCRLCQCFGYRMQRRSLPSNPNRFRRN
ncbi:hypothetical protein NY2A_b042R [Paramecium bursaria Chlorella virus NY2A]|uniref:Uncharacterized protein b042R n=1 Tax=Paramecium bursaria Chlorella virus NY2A TaxID=46021 RepID=A7IVR7_PBCVN|nr:hypothetical protein NY2A_b042R [Paramecium bursaria Chlorella virus NY2A]ABT14441.1 hypothetical protein NY2A_b042R [Paramecium bursaria Chlorella virus NY2A]